MIKLEKTIPKLRDGLFVFFLLSDKYYRFFPEISGLPMTTFCKTLKTLSSPKTLIEKCEHTAPSTLPYQIPGKTAKIR